MRRHVANEQSVVYHGLKVVNERTSEKDHHLPLLDVQKLALDVQARVALFHVLKILTKKVF